ncbi:hypothetical protein CPJCM30710_22080 [Clostridium polyendosporum]|uniref:Methyltransferase type 11 domain-containing protein n=1 Tax=Clostridium polyendosporum TaxID=69208 RepID=A0A919S0F7_9CLOT|nr:class I SAM-dependent methyltransferase [Clostridium polyendosporum]GIM29542.1 hypothetical protein CPJCM30710_22080 [Clostridium polyendosporum]
MLKLSPKLYRTFIRPKWFTNLFINNMIKKEFNFTNKSVLDFGCGVGCSCSIFEPIRYLGIDCDMNRIVYARRLNPNYKFEVIRSNDKLPIADNSVDYIIISSVLHHIPTEYIRNYAKEFHRILNPHGSILVIEPVFIKGSSINNRFMAYFDKGKYIRHQLEYFQMFNSCNFKTRELKKYTQLLFYNKIFFEAQPINNFKLSL